MRFVSDLEQEYSPSSRVGGSSQPFVDDYVARSATARDELGDRVRTLDGGTRFVSAGQGAPLLVFVHGGYWQALSAEASLYLAPGALAHGWSYAAVEYPIAPGGTLPAMVAACRDALAELAALGPHREVVVAGHSAGAHLTAMVALAATPPLAVDRVVLLSGVFDLRPLVHTTVNEPLRLDDASAAALSPALLPTVSPTRTLVAWGDNETDAFKAQSHVMAVRLRLAGAGVTELERAPRHHFDIVDDLVDPADPIGAFTLGGIG
jgi:arylformamidase